jgi:hypothetical protein
MTEKYYVTFQYFNKTVILAYIYTLNIVIQRIMMSSINLLCCSMGLKYFMCITTNKKYSVEHNTSLEAYSRSCGQQINFVHGTKQLNTGYTHDPIMFAYATGKIILRIFTQKLQKKSQLQSDKYGP